MAEGESFKDWAKRKLGIGGNAAAPKVENSYELEKKEQSAWELKNNPPAQSTGTPKSVGGGPR